MEGLQRNHHNNCINWMISNLEFQTEEQEVNPVCSSWTPSLGHFSPHRNSVGKLRMCGKKVPIVSRAEESTESQGKVVGKQRGDAG